jgi:hypothetical protein
MSTEKKPKWEIGATINAGQNAHALALKYREQLEHRLQPDELEQLKSNTSELAMHRSGQTENLVIQKSKTSKQDESIITLQDTTVSIRNIVKNSSQNTPDILKAFGVGEKMTSTVSNAISGGNLVMAAYKTYTEWSNNAGIIEADIAEISSLVARLSSAGETQDNAMFIRKSKTMDKNVLQRTVEDEVSKISALGQHVFLHKDAAIAKLFENLTPSITKTKTDSSKKAEKTPQENITA